MRSRTLFLASVVALAACYDSDPTSPRDLLSNGPSSAISDGANGGNPDFWFLPPVVDNPNGNPLYLDNGATTAPNAMVQIYDVTGGTPGTSIFGPAPAIKGTSQYQLDWSIPDGANKIYRIYVLVGNETLGFADVKTASSPGKVKNATTNDEIVVADGRNLPIKFVIESFALCDEPGEPCSEEEVNLAEGDTVVLDIPGYGRSGVIIPAQPGGGTTTITLRLCDENDPESGFDDMNPAVTDLPTFGPCMSVNADPPLSVAMSANSGQLVNAATVFICDITPDLGDMLHEQQERVTMHRWDNGPDELWALPHAPHVCGSPVASAGSNGFFANLVRGDFRAAGRQLVSLVSPRPLYAAVMLDVGGGGFTFEFSAFQFALPAKLTIVGEDGGDFGDVPADTTVNATVLVTDLGGLPVQGARVRFVTSFFECDPDAEAPSISSVIGTVVTPDNGQASTAWTINAGEQTLYACGRGLGGNDVNGPRGQGTEGDSEVDPFQPLSVNLGDASNGPAVLHRIGSVQFSAFGDEGEVVVGRIRTNQTLSPADARTGTTAIRSARTKTKTPIRRDR